MLRALEMHQLYMEMQEGVLAPRGPECYLKAERVRDVNFGAQSYTATAMQYLLGAGGGLMTRLGLEFGMVLTQVVAAAPRS